MRHFERLMLAYSQHPLATWCVWPGCQSYSLVGGPVCIVHWQALWEATAGLLIEDKETVLLGLLKSKREEKNG